ncbi:MAG: preprotein translocase subunit SecA [Oscillospiraceae bacterium]|jgi:preprotein translocase subunit SecA|nr:preprotein translocase subunit SecA [Oscillospiraceae bacterium]
MSKKSGISIEKIKTLAENPIAGLLEKAANDRNYALAACCNAAKTALSVTPFDEQLYAAEALYGKKIVEMKTGEGKTLAAVFAAFLARLDGRKVHILTFNDYLAKRDYNWMKPVYALLGTQIAVITEKTTPEERRAAYKSDVVYCAVKESGFDFLRDFTVYDKSERLHDYRSGAGALDFAIFDEADSVLIDEARIPLVIAADADAFISGGFAEIYDFVKNFDDGDYETDDENETVFLTDGGVKKTEERYGADNLYDEENRDLLCGVNVCLKAAFYLKKDKHYVVKDGKIRIIDALTGRIAENRLFPGALQSAVEVKHGLNVSERGVIAGVIPIQYFARQYKDIAGMTGTALPSAEEFELLYGLRIEEIPPRVPCSRIDNPMEVYLNGEAKWNAVVNETARVHKKKQPVLIGTSTIEESEMLASKLKDAGVSGVRVLNAKNDEMEAEIIKNAGEFGAVTVSTNMAGRGIDIKLGGFDETTRDEAVEAGGLFVIGTALYENARMNEQLNGRSGRQGDAGETKLFVALDDDIMVKYGLKKLLPKRRLPDFTGGRLTDKNIVREAKRIQRIAQGDLLEERKRLLKFTIIGEKHRDIIFKKRLEYLSGETKPDIWQKHAEEEYAKAAEKFGEEGLNALQKEVILSAINEVWRDYLEYASDLRSGIHLRAVAGRSPAEEYNIDCETYFGGIEERLIKKINDCLFEISGLGELSDYAVFKPKNTRTYLMEESGDELVKKPFLLNAFGEEEEEENDDDEDGAEGVGPRKGGFFTKLFGEKRGR